MKNKQKLNWINLLVHNVYKGCMYFFDKYFDLTIYHGGLKIDYGCGKKIEIENYYGSNFIPSNSFYISKKPTKNDKNSIYIIGDIFTINLCLAYRGKNVIYYTEFFIKNNDNIFRKILFYLYGSLFYNRKILTPTLKSFNTLKVISSNVEYFPPIYYGDINKNNNLENNKLKILFVGSIDDWKKNITLLINSIIDLSEKYKNIELHIAGPVLHNKPILEPYKKYIDNGLIKYYGKISHEKLLNIYLECNLFILPSLIDPIGAVVLEAMANGLPIIVSDNVGAADYIEEGKNGYIFKSQNKNDLIDKIEIFVKNPKLLQNMGDRSYEIIKEKFWYQNEELLEEKYNQLVKLVNK